MNFDQLFSKYSSYIYNYALKLSCDPSVAEDISQETFLKAWKNKGQLKNEEAIKYWLRKICLNTFLMKLRKEKGKIDLSYDELTSLEREGSVLQISSPSPSPEDEVIVDEAIKEIQNGCFLAMVRRLTPNQRIAFSLIDMFGLSMDEVANLLGLSKSAIKALLHRARMNLDDFFSRRCNLVKVSNPCNCIAWRDFAKHRNDIKNKALKKKLISSLDYTKANYAFDPEIRKKVQYLYSNMPDRKPSQEWYDNVIRLIGEIYEG
ncbi:RNA polymerase sigma factor [Wukongibacter baidiensis]|uniref:RNA polymerase sigma factor n=1 Tax=Wukongibacter baidiensis TaxID=1723361 RepID=UPI003D7FD940